METGYKIGDCMTIQPVTIATDIPISECAKIMRDKRVGSLLVMDKGKLVGLITERDLVRKAMAEALDTNKTFVKDVMIPLADLVTIGPEKDIYDALKTMRDYGIRHLPVMQRGQLVGFLTQKDVLKIQPQLFDLVVEKIALREESRKPLNADGTGICDGCGNYSADLEEVDGAVLCPECRTTEDHAEENEEEDF